MLKVNNKKIIREIARTTYKENKKRNFLTIFAIMLTTFLISVVLSVGVSYWNTIRERQIRMQGMDYDISLSEPRKDQVEKIRSMDNVEYAGVAVKCAVLKEYKDRLLDKTRLFYLDEICWEKQTVPALESYRGHYPQNENEVMFSTGTLRSMGIQNPKLGMKLPVTYFSLSEEQDEGLLQKDFVLCGWYTDYSGSVRGYVSHTFLESTGVRQTDFTQGTLKITLKSPLYSKKDITEMIGKINLDRNQYMDADYDTISNFCHIVVCLAVMLLMVFASGYLFIYNTLYISISRDIRYYGQLKTVGTTSTQLKSLIYRQAVWNAGAGIPLGLLAAAVVEKMIIPRLLHIINPVFSAEDIVSVKIWVFLLAGCFAFFTNLIGCKEPAKMAGNCSPVEALRFTGISNRQKDRKRKKADVYSMAWQNIFRDKKQAVVIFTSFVIALSIFLVINVVIRGNDAKHILNETSTYDIQFKNETTLDEDKKQIITDEKIAQIEKIKGVKKVRKVTSAMAIVPYQKEVYGEYYKELYQSRYSPGNYEEDMEEYRKNPEGNRFSARFISVDERGFEVLNEKLGNVLDKKSYEDGKIAVAIKTFTEGDNGITGKTARFYLPEGKEPEKKHEILIAAVGSVYENPAFFAGGYTPDFIVSEKYAKKVMGDLFTELICVEYNEPYSEETEQKVKSVFRGNKQISCESKLENYREMKNTEMQVKVLGNSLGLIIGMLAILNYLNMMASGIQNRSKELAILESIGMTTKQIRKMLRIEGIGYGIISIFIAILFGLPISRVVFYSMNLYQISFSVPWTNNLILFGVILLLCMTVPVCIYRKTQKGSILERLRSEE